MDLYELTMSNGIFDSEMRDETVYFDMFSAGCRTTAAML